jgi:hypothetical protein
VLNADGGAVVGWIRCRSEMADLCGTVVGNAETNGGTAGIVKDVPTFDGEGVYPFVKFT